MKTKTTVESDIKTNLCFFCGPRASAPRKRVSRMSSDQQLPFGLAGMECLECVYDIFGCWWGVANHERYKLTIISARPFCCRSHVTMRRGLIRMRFLRTQPRYSKLPSIIFNFNYIYAAPILLRVSFFLCFSFLFSPLARGDDSAARQKEISDWSPRERTTHLMRFSRDV